ncbi:AAA family ATPase [Bariatricus sp. HCP28S3_E4]|uniref:AAA family ATPase n=2 Tax=unclassified Bariatricus TaxID=2677046 RepID=UPI002A7DEB30|nr:AAA family ATPase [Bariatricus sp.]
MIIHPVIRSFLYNLFLSEDELNSRIFAEGSMSHLGKYLNIGNAGFETVRKGIYVDKTGLISFINSTLGTSDKMTCVSRPRRFGKSFAAKMHVRNLFVL